MTQLNDPPWIRMTELYGPDDGEEIETVCPCCGAHDVETFYTDSSGVDVVGCEVCLHRHDAYEWLADRKRRQ